MSVSLCMEIAEGNTGLYSDWEVAPQFCLWGALLAEMASPLSLLKSPIWLLSTSNAPSARKFITLAPPPVSQGLLGPLLRPQLLIVRHTAGFCSRPF